MDKNEPFDFYNEIVDKYILNLITIMAIDNCFSYLQLLYDIYRFEGGFIKNESENDN